MTESLQSESKRGVPLWAQLLIWAGLLGLLALVALGLAKAKTPILTNGSAVPEFTLPLYEGYEYGGAADVTLAALRGKVVVLNFWASWCKPCESEAADLEAAWRIYQPGGEVVFLGVDYVDTEPEARSYLAKFDITYPNGPDMGTRISQIFNRNLGVPETYVIDRQGILRYVKIGPFASVEEIQAVVESVLAGE
ncbi:MAG: TlpA family protein disulfide reductase [Chloroflexi bacterium]|nr:TlpA family protein disulfide reductase [Chloroflexota bacterium]